LMALCFLPTSLFSNRLYFPQLSFGGGSTTTIILMNAGTTSVSSEFRIYSQSGVLLRSIPTTLPDSSSTRLTIADPGPSIITSWAMLDTGIATVKGVASIDMRLPTGGDIRAGVFGVEAANDFIFPVDVTENGAGFNTAFAIANVDTQNIVTVNFQFMPENGNGAAPAMGLDGQSITLGPRQQFAGLVTQVWPQLAMGFRGLLRVSLTPAQAHSLILTAFNVKDGLLVAVPAMSGTQQPEPPVPGEGNPCYGCWDY
jgi:hypothetical protein